MASRYFEDGTYVHQREEQGALPIGGLGSRRPRVVREGFSEEVGLGQRETKTTGKLQDHRQGKLSAKALGRQEGASSRNFRARGSLSTVGTHSERQKGRRDGARETGRAHHKGPVPCTGGGAVGARKGLHWDSMGIRARRHGGEGDPRVPARPLPAGTLGRLPSVPGLLPPSVKQGHLEGQEVSSVRSPA